METTVVQKSITEPSVLTVAIGAKTENRMYANTEIHLWLLSSLTKFTFPNILANVFGISLS